MKHVSRHLLALGTMLMGSSMVFGVVYAMNEASLPPPKPPAKPQASFEVEPPPPKPKPKKQKVERRRAEAKARQAAPAPHLASAISGPSFDLPQFEGSDVGQVDDDLLGDTRRDQVFTADAVDEKPAPLSRVEPQFPDRARRDGTTGYVKLNLLINTSGEVETVKVLDAAPRGVFEAPALAAVQRWRFEPPRYQGEPVKMWFKQTVTFRLD